MQWDPCLSIAKHTLNLQSKLKRKISKPIYLKDNVLSFSKKKEKDNVPCLRLICQSSTYLVEELLVLICCEML